MTRHRALPTGQLLASDASEGPVRPQFAHMTVEWANEISLNCTAVSFLRGALADPGYAAETEGLMAWLDEALMRIQALVYASMTGEAPPPEVFCERFDNLRDRLDAIVDCGVFSVHRKTS